MVAKASRWVSLFKRIARNRLGLSSPLLRRLYRAVAIPKITYAADVWFTPIHLPPGAKWRSGSVGAANRLTRVQQQAAIAITGCFRTTATDYVEAHANLMPIDLVLKDLCLQAITRMVSLNDEHHPLTKVVWHARQNVITPPFIYWQRSLTCILVRLPPPPPSYRLRLSRRPCSAQKLPNPASCQWKPSEMTAQGPGSIWMAPPLKKELEHLR